MAEAPPIRRGVLLAYALPALPLAILGLPLNVYLPAFWGETMGLGLSTVGAILLATRLFDALIDPAIGTLSDRTRMGWGRRRPFIAVGVLVAAPAAWLLLVPPQGAGAWSLLLYSALVSLGWSLINIPHTAWGAELSADYDQRARITGAREAATLGGIVVSALIPALWPGGIAEDLRALAAVTLVLALPAVGLLVAVVPEVKPPSTPRGPWLPDLRPILANAPFRRLLVAWILNGMANGLPAALFLLVVTHLLGASDRSGPLLLAYFAAGIASVPFWLWVARRTSKHRAWCIAMVWACLVFATVPLLGQGDWLAFLGVCVLSGAALGADLALPPAIQADVIDLDTERTGQPRTGLFFAAWSLAQKAGQALAVGIGLPLLEALGFRTGPEGATGLGALVGLYAVAPILLKLAAVTLMWRFPLDRTTQAALRARLAAG